MQHSGVKGTPTSSSSRSGTPHYRLHFHWRRERDPKMKTTVIIKKNRDFTRMCRRAKCKTGPLLVTYCARNRLGHNRIGITASKRVGDAVRRNRAKRVIRAAYTGLEPQLPQGYDFIFVARSRTAHCKMQPVQQAMLGQIAALTAAPSAVREAGRA